MGMHCISCKYDLSGLDGDRCPECGRQFDPRDPRTFRETRYSGPKLRWALALFGGALALGVVFACRAFGVPRGSLEIVLIAVVALVFASILSGILWLIYVAVSSWWESH